MRHRCDGHHPRQHEKRDQRIPEPEMLEGPFPRVLHGQRKNSLDHARGYQPENCEIEFHRAASSRTRSSCNEIPSPGRSESVTCPSTASGSPAKTSQNKVSSSSGAPSPGDGKYSAIGEFMC